MSDENEIKLIKWDAPEQERFHSIIANTIKSWQGIVLIFGITNIAASLYINAFGNKCNLFEYIHSRISSD